MVVKVGSQYHVKNHDGTKTLGKFATRTQAVKRLREIEYFKAQPKKPKVK